MSRLLQKFGPLAPVVGFFTAGLLLFFVARLALAIVYHDHLSHIAQPWLLLPVGLRIDVMLLSLAVCVPALLVLSTPQRYAFFLNPIVRTYFTALAIVFVFLEIATFPFIAEYGSRPNQLFVQYLTHPQEVLESVWAQSKLSFFVAAVAIVFTGRYAWRGLAALTRNASWSFTKRGISIVFVTLLLILGARSGPNKTAPNPSLAAFSSDHLVNQLALNSTYSLSFSIYRQYQIGVFPQDLYAKMPADEMFNRIKRVMSVAPTMFTDRTLPSLHGVATNVARRDPNLVIVVMESFGSEHVGRQTGLPLTPNFDRLAEKGIFFDKLYSTGVRTFRGLESLVSGFPPLPHTNTILKQDLSQQGFFTIANLLKQRGYRASFIYGGESHFDNMSGFLMGNGFDDLLDEKTMVDAVFNGTWGASDEDLFRHANNYFKQQTSPFVSVILTVSNHVPFDFPDGRIDLYESPKATERNATRYSDFAIGKFMEEASKEPYFNNTYFLFCADHPIRVSGRDLVPVEKYHIPAIIVGPTVQPLVYDKIASQIDLLPTLLAQAGIDLATPMIGRDVLSLPPQDPGRAIMQYDGSIAYRRGDDVVIWQEYKAPRQFKVQNGELQEASVDSELAQDALAHILFPGIAYQQRLYRLP